MSKRFVFGTLYKKYVNGWFFSDYEIAGIKKNCKKMLVLVAVGVILVATVETSLSTRHHNLPVMNHLVSDDDYYYVPGGGEEDQRPPLLPHPQRQVMTESTLLSDSHYQRHQQQRCPEECRCDEQIVGAATVHVAECWNVASLPALLLELGGHRPAITTLSITYCDGQQWLDVSNGTTFKNRRGSVAQMAPSLVDLTLAGCPLDDDVGGSWLGSLMLLPQLAVLSYLRLADSSLAVVKLDALKLASLERLDLADNRLTEVIVVDRDAAPEKRPKLRQVNFAGNKLTTLDLGALVRQFPDLEQLNVSANSLESISGSSSSGTAAIGVSQLRQLDLSRNPKLELVCNAALSMVPNLGNKSGLLMKYGTSFLTCFYLWVDLHQTS